MSFRPVQNVFIARLGEDARLMRFQQEIYNGFRTASHRRWHDNTRQEKMKIDQISEHKQTHLSVLFIVCDRWCYTKQIEILEAACPCLYDI